MLYSIIPTLAFAFVPDVRPDYESRKFHSSAIDDFITNRIPDFKDPELATLFQNTFPNTLDTTVYSTTTGDSFIITGDINAMWLRDSCNQVLPYVQFISQDSALDNLLTGTVMRMARSVLLDSYANAFNIDGSRRTEHWNDVRTPKMTNAVFEGKYELDSLAAFLKLSRSVYSESSTLFKTQSDDLIIWLDAVTKTIATIKEQQKSTDEDNAQSSGPAYLFKRYTDVASDTLI
jgi:meiotically up-regulated gene 157 (Mug157) protein